MQIKEARTASRNVSVACLAGRCGRGEDRQDGHTASRARPGGTHGCLLTPSTTPDGRPLAPVAGSSRKPAVATARDPEAWQGGTAERRAHRPSTAAPPAEHVCAAMKGASGGLKTTGAAHGAAVLDQADSV